ncbi:MAG: twin-arginine translocase subunit TatC [Dehalococcoidales bacterium]|nr:twin-arginine translocase subunit TatC [Dehalococcoidales bacterium]
MSDDRRLSILEHIRELRIRLTRSVIAVAITTIISFIFAGQIFELLTYKSPFSRAASDIMVNKFHLLPVPDVNLVYIDMTEMLGIYMKVCLVAGIILAIPYLLYQVLMFVSPGLTSKEKKYVYLVLPWVSLMFLVGVAFGYFILIPPATKFLLTFGSDIATPQIRVGNYISLVTRMLLAIGLVFELPVFITLLARLGVVTHKWLAGKRRWAIVVAFVLGAAITPTLDPVNQCLVAVPLILLYEVSIWLARFVQRKRVKAAATSTE